VTGGNAVCRAGVSRSGAWVPGVSRSRLSRFGMSRSGLPRSRPRRGALDTCLMLIDGGTCIPTMASPFA